MITLFKINNLTVNFEGDRSMRPSTEIDTLRQQLPYHKLRKVKKEQIVPIDWQTEWERFDAAELFNYDLRTIPEKLLENMQKRQDVLMDGNQAALSVLTRVVDGLCGYPITPSTPIAENFAKAASNGQKNLFGHELMYFQPSDELSAIAAVEAMACQGGQVCGQYLFPGPGAEDQESLFRGRQTPARGDDGDGPGGQQGLAFAFTAATPIFMRCATPAGPSWCPKTTRNCMTCCPLPSRSPNCAR